MSVWKRAKLYLMRKKGKTLILLTIMTVITTLVLTCLSVGNAANENLQKLRESMGGYFKIETDFEHGKTGYVSDEMIQQLMDTGKIKHFNGMDFTYLMVEDIMLKPGRFTGQMDEKAKLARVLGNTDSSQNEYFVLRYFSLKEG